MTRRIESIAKKWPASTEVLERIDRIRVVVADLDDEPVIEPWSLIDWPSKGKRKYVNFTPVHFVGGLRHASGSARARMTMLEEAILTVLDETGVYPAAVLVRSHMEAAGLAALALVEGTLAMKAGNLGKVQDLVLALQFGTSLRREGKKNEIVEESLKFSETDPLRAAKLVEGMDRYSAAGEDVGRYFRASYALLCEYAHATMRVSRRFADIEERGVAGWVIQYHRSEEVDAGETEGVLESLLKSMQIGHSAAEMLRHVELVRLENDAVDVMGPDEAVGSFVWRHLLQREMDNTGVERNGA